MSSRDLVVASAGSAGAAKDDYFKNVSLLLSGDGTNGAQNNTFLDSSTNNFTITRNGNTTQGTFSPYGNLWSNYFDGTGDYLTVAGNAAFNLNSTNWTIEYWFYNNQAKTATHISQGENVWRLNQESNNTLKLNIAGTEIVTSALALSTWHHIAAVRNGSTNTLYVNGVSVGTSVANPASDSTSVVYIGRNPGASGAWDFNGYISNLRIVKGTALYTSNFTPSTTPLTAVSGTSLLTCQSNRFIDNSSNNFTLTVNGNTSVQRFSPFNPTAPYSAATIGGSGYFDGSGDYLSIADNAAFTLGTSNFTYETWFYPTFAAAGYGSLVGNRATTSAFGEFNITISNNGKMGVFVGDNWSIIADNASLAPYTLNAWNHCALVRNGTSFAFFVNGVRYITATSSSSISNNGATWTIGEGAAAGGQPFYGYITNSRLVVGTAVYDPTQSTLTVPTAPLTAITNTSLLCNFTNAGIPDAAMMNDLETIGNAQVSTSVKKYGTGSLYFDGTGDYLKAPTSQTTNFGTGDYTIEGWFYRSGNGTHPGFLETIMDTRTSDVNNGGGFAFGTNSSNQFVTYGCPINTGPVATGSFTAGQWNHFAISQQSGTVKVFINGSQVYSASNSGANYNHGGLWVATAGGSGAGGYTFNGYIDDLRITKGLARYTANFTPPAQALPTN